LPHPVFAATAACMLFRRAAYDVVGGFDGDYFLSYDEIDLCWRTWLAGFAVYCVPSAVIWHKPSTTANTFFKSQLSFFDCRNRLNSMIKNYSSPVLARYLIPSILANLFDLARQLIQNDRRGATGTLRAYGEIIAGLNETLRKRWSVQRSRIIPDSYLLDNGLIIPMNFSRLYKLSTQFD
jgi:GT2 family glycosyltransferase